MFRGVQPKQEQWAVDTRFLYSTVTQCHGSIGGGTELRIGESEFFVIFNEK